MGQIPKKPPYRRIQRLFCNYELQIPNYELGLYKTYPLAPDSTPYPRQRGKCCVRKPALYVQGWSPPREGAGGRISETKFCTALITNL